MGQACIPLQREEGPERSNMEERKESKLFPYSGNPDGSIELCIKKAIADGIISEDVPLALFMNLDVFRGRCDELRTAFAKNGLDKNITNAFAIKALQSGGLCAELNKLNTMGIECASFGELLIALKSNTPLHEIVFDSPCKSRSELEYCIKNKIFLNLDNFDELQRVQEIMKNMGDTSGIDIGIRVNPVIGAGTISSHSTSTVYSKFGINMVEHRDALVEAYKNNQPWLNAIHCHVGSQGMTIEQQTGGIKKVVDFVESNLSDVIKTIDVGGGLSVNFNGYEHTPTFTQYVESLKKTSPVLFDGKYKVWTEFGRAIAAKSGFMVSRVEYVKRAAEKYIVVVHCGANIFIRNAYVPKEWRNYITVYDAKGNVKQTDDEKELIKCDVVGPLCFSGDCIARNRCLPKVEPGDYIAVHDAGAYTLSMYSQYNSRPFPPIYGFEKEDSYDAYDDQAKLSFKVLKKGQTSEEVATFWTE
eukprot:657832_1